MANRKKETVQTAMILGVESVIEEKVQLPVEQPAAKPKPYTNHGPDKIGGKDVYRIGGFEIFNDEKGVRKPFVCIAISTNPSTEATRAAQKAARTLTVPAQLKKNSEYRTSVNLIVDGTTVSDMPFIQEHIKHGGKVMAIIPQGRSNYTYTDEIKQMIIDNQLVLVTVAGKDDKWTMEWSQERNDLISKLAMTFFSPEVKGAHGVYDLACRFHEAGKAIYIPKINNGSPHTHDAMVMRLKAIQLPEEPKGVANESINIYQKIFFS